jgi:ABC-type multidrug transport system, permease component
MKILILVWKEFRQNVRNWKANSMMVLFPIVLILILGTAFSRVFDDSIALDNVRVLYTLNSSNGLSSYFKSFTEHGKEMGIKFEETSDVDAGVRSVQDVTYSCYILFENDSNEVKLYKNARYNFEAGFVQGFVDSFISRYNAYAEIGKSNPEALGKIMAEEGKNYVNTMSLDKKRKPRALDYYAITMLTLILMYSSLTGFWGVKSEQNHKTGSRILCSPIHKSEFLTGKVIGCIFVTFIQAAVVIAFSRYVMGAYWGNDIFTIALLVLSQAIMTISLGASIAFLIKNEGAASGLLNSVIPIVVLLGGGYTPLENMGPFIARISDISPVKWINSSMLRVIYDNDYSLVPIAIIINLALAAVFIGVVALLSKKEVA